MYIYIDVDIDIDWSDKEKLNSPRFIPTLGKLFI